MAQPQPRTINPYPEIAKMLPTGLNTVIAALPSGPSVDDLVNEVAAYIESVFYPSASTQVQAEITSVAYHAINSFRSNLVLNGNAMYNSNQAPFIQMLIGPGMTLNTAPDSFLYHLNDIEDNVGISELNVPDQVPLYLATGLGSFANVYWVDELANPTSDWLVYFSANTGQNYMNTMQWSVAAMNGALAGYGATQNSLIEPTVNSVTNQMVSALIGALTITAGKVIFNWIPRITKPIATSLGSLSAFREQNLDIIHEFDLPVNGGFAGKKHRSNWARATCTETCMDIREDDGSVHTTVCL